MKCNKKVIEKPVCDEECKRVQEEKRKVSNHCSGVHGYYRIYMYMYMYVYLGGWSCCTLCKYM